MSLRLKMAGGIVGLAIICVGIYWYFASQVAQVPDFSEQVATPAPQPVDRQPPYRDVTSEKAPEVVAPAPQVEPPPAPEPDPRLLPPPLELTGSDPSVAKALTVLSPALSQWLIPEEQVRKWVLAIDLVADGKLPRRYRPIDYPMGKFAVVEKGDQLLAAEQNHTRINALLDALEAIEIPLLAAFYQGWKPILAEAYREQGKPGTLDQRLQLAISQVLAVSAPPEEAALKRPGVLYQYADEQWEVATDIEKLCWRMGEDNTLRLQAFVRELRSALQ